MGRLAVWVERLEGFVRVGSLSFGRGADEQFEYDWEYLQREDAVPVYPSLPEVIPMTDYGMVNGKAVFELAQRLASQK